MSHAAPRRLAAALWGLGLSAPIAFAGSGTQDLHLLSSYPATPALETAAVMPVGHHSETAADIVDTAAAAGGFETLVRAVQAAGLVETLKGPGPYTVFAPTDEAFARLPAGTLEALLADKAALIAVLTYHVVPGKVMASEVARLTSARTVQGQTLRIDTRDGVRVDQAKVIKTDVETANGVIHVIDAVLVPEGVMGEA